MAVLTAKLGVRISKQSNTELKKKRLKALAKMATNTRYDTAFLTNDFHSSTVSPAVHWAPGKLKCEVLFIGHFPVLR